MKTDLKTIDTKIALVRKNGDEFNTLIHDTAMMILIHAKEHGDCSRAQHLVMAMPASMRRTSLIVWFSDYSPIVVKNAEDWNARMQKPETATGKPNPLYKPFNIETAENDPWYKHAERNREANFVPLKFEDMVQQVQQFAGRIIKQIDDGKVADDDLESAKALARTLEDLHFTKVKKDAENASTNDDDAELKDLRAKYKAAFGKKAYPGWTAETLAEKLADNVESIPAQERAAA
jgi:hypothetical protein